MNIDDYEDHKPRGGDMRAGVQGLFVPQGCSATQEDNDIR